MKNKKGAIFLVAILAVMLVGAYVLYGNLSKGGETDQLIELGGGSKNAETVGNQDSPSAETVSPAAQQAPQSNDDAVSGEEAPPESDGANENAGLMLAHGFTVYDKSGAAVKLSDFIGKPIVLNFWASWCGPCRSEMPDFNEAYLELGDEITFLMINLTDGQRDTVSGASAFIANNGYSFPVYYDTSGDAAHIYGVYSIPTTFFINADGYLVAQANGAISSDVLMQGINMIK